MKTISAAFLRLDALPGVNHMHVEFLHKTETQISTLNRHFVASYDIPR